MKPDIIIRAILANPQAVLAWDLEPTQDAIHLARRTVCDRYGYLGTPCSDLDILIQRDINPQFAACLEVGRKQGKYDGRERTRIVVRSHHASMDTYPSPVKRGEVDTVCEWSRTASRGIPPRDWRADDDEEDVDAL